MSTLLCFLHPSAPPLPSPLLLPIFTPSVFLSRGCVAQSTDIHVLESYLAPGRTKSVCFSSWFSSLISSLYPVVSSSRFVHFVIIFHSAARVWFRSTCARTNSPRLQYVSIPVARNFSLILTLPSPIEISSTLRYPMDDRIASSCGSGSAKRKKPLKR